MTHISNNLIRDKYLESAIRVNHAGEYGAKRIYAGQLAVFRAKNDQKTAALIQHMKEQEDVHFDYFDRKMIKTKTRPTIMQPLWQIAGFALGFSTALMGKKSAMACTVAVEEVIDEHYQEQLRSLKGDDADTREIKDKIDQFRKEELEHRDIGLENNAQDSPLYTPLTFFIKNASKLAIAISKKI